MFIVLMSFLLSSYAAGFNAKQEALRTDIANNLSSNDYSVERKEDGLMFMNGGDTYYIEIDESDTNPMYVRLVRYIKFNDTIERSEVMKNLKEYNSTYAIKAYCKEKNVILSAEMFVTTPDQFTNVLGNLLFLMKSVSEAIIK